jgi:hypothetical protein
MPQHHWLVLGSILAVVSCGAGFPAISADPKALVQTLDERSCTRCNLQDADLVHADLRDARLQGAQLQRANLSGARLDGADLRHADLSFTSLAGASLQGADLRGATLTGTDFRNSNLSDAHIDPGSLSRSHWHGARGVSASLHSYAELHNAGVQAALNSQHPEAERWFSEAIKRIPNAAVSWVARGISRAEQGNLALASQDLRYAGTLYAQLGDQKQAEALTKAAELLIQPTQRPKGGNGIGSQLMTSAMAAFQFLAPLAAKTMLPMPF